MGRVTLCIIWLLVLVGSASAQVCPTTISACASPTYNNLTAAQGTFTTLNGAGVTSLFASPFGIGSTTPNTGAFTTLAINTALTSTQTGLFTGAQMNEYNSFLLNGMNTTTEWLSNHPGTYATDAIAAGVAVPSSSTKVGSNAVAGYVSNASTTTMPVAGYFQARALANNVQIWSTNPLVADGGFTGVTMQNEIDLNSTNPDNGGNPALDTTISGIDIIGTWTGARSKATGVNIQVTNGGTFAASFESSTGASNVGLSLLPRTTGASASGQFILLNAFDASSALQSCTENATPLTAGASLQLFCSTGNIILGGVTLATTATTGFAMIPTAPGIFTGTVGAAGQAAIGINTASHKLCHSEGGGVWYDAEGASCS
jgi:hypothetical protein